MIKQYSDRFYSVKYLEIYFKLGFILTKNDNIVLLLVTYFLMTDFFKSSFIYNRVITDTTYQINLSKNST